VTLRLLIESKSEEAFEKEASQEYFFLFFWPEIHPPPFPQKSHKTFLLSIEHSFFIYLVDLSVPAYKPESLVPGRWL
jgi:hypothetical protein